MLQCQTMEGLGGNNSQREEEEEEWGHRAEELWGKTEKKAEEAGDICAFLMRWDKSHTSRPYSHVTMAEGTTKRW